MSVFSTAPSSPPPPLPPPRVSALIGDLATTRSKMAASSSSSSLVDCRVTLQPRAANQSLGLYIRGGADSNSTPTITDLDVGGYAASQVRIAECEWQLSLLFWNQSAASDMVGGTATNK